jgi:hypothetical protein
MIINKIDGESCLKGMHEPRYVIYDELDGTAFKTMSRDVYNANNFKAYVLVLHVAYYYK